MNTQAVWEQESCCSVRLAQLCAAAPALLESTISSQVCWRRRLTPAPHAGATAMVTNPFTCENLSQEKSTCSCRGPGLRGVNSK